jgi:hypothetical protein
MSSHPSAAERIDHAIERLLDGASPARAAAISGVDASARAAVERAALVMRSLPLPPIAPRFEARLGARLGTGTSRDPLAWALGHPGRLIVTGAVGSALGVGVTAFAVWRSTRRPSGVRLLHR